VRVQFIDNHPELDKDEDGRPLDNEGYIRYDRYKNYFFIDWHQIKLSCPVTSYLVVDDKCLVFLDTDDDFCKSHDVARSIWCYDSSGEKLWEVEDAFLSLCRQRKKKYPYLLNAYSGMHQRDDGIILVYTEDGFTGELDIETGLVGNWAFTR